MFLALVVSGTETKKCHVYLRGNEVVREYDNEVKCSAFERLQ